MKTWTVTTACLAWVCGIVLPFHLQAQPERHDDDVHLIGEMRNVMWKGELFGNIALDTISTKQHLYGLGPVEYLSGEILILDGVSYVSRVVNERKMRVKKTYRVKAPFFGYAHIDRWTEVKLPDSIQTMQALQEYLDDITLMRRRPFFFRLTGMIDSAQIHVVNLPGGAKVSSPAEAHQGMVKYILKNEAADILGFFSTEHQAIFTHHDTFLHLHLITADRKNMGHVDDVVLRKGGVRLYLPGA